MTEKRFKVYKVSGNFGVWEVEDTLTDTVVMDTIMHKYLADRLCEKLNELSDENEELKQSHKEILKDLEVTTFDRELLQKENEQLKYTLGAYMVDLNNCKGKCSTLEIENEQLKKDNQQLHQIESKLRVRIKELEQKRSGGIK